VYDAGPNRYLKPNRPLGSLVVRNHSRLSPQGINELRVITQYTSLGSSRLRAPAHLSNRGENKFGIFMVFIDDMNMCFTLWLSGSLWFAIGNHAAWDWDQTFLFGTPDSGLHGQHALMNPTFHGPTLLAGGTDGPEGSVLVVLSEGPFLVLVAIIYRRRRYPLICDRAVK
jgi:hypothetical protein